MAADSKIEWTHHTFNPWRGCTKVSAGCAHCYAETLSKRNPNVLGVWGPNGQRAIASESYWREPIKWNAAAEKAGERHRVFCASLADWLEGPETMPAYALPLIRRARVRLLDLIRQTPSLDWLLLSKRPENWRNAIEESIILAEGGDPDDKNYFHDRDGSFPANELSHWLNEWTGDEPPANVWLGTSVEDQEQANKRIPHLLKCPATVRFLSAEPLLGKIDLRAAFIRNLHDEVNSGYPGLEIPEHLQCHVGRIDWVIVGGESGKGARPFDLAWANSIRKQCAASNVPCFIKQFGACPENTDPDLRCGGITDSKGGDFDEFPDALKVRQFPKMKGSVL